MASDNNSNSKRRVPPLLEPIHRYNNFTVRHRSKNITWKKQSDWSVNIACNNPRKPVKRNRARTITFGINGIHKEEETVFLFYKCK